jgi:para-aminobenzoate synthetase / 4-amino-4-deoxychorismate lyase
MMISTQSPFVLLDDARSSGAVAARYYTNPLQMITVQNADELPALFAAIRQAKQNGLHMAGYIAYEAGFALEGQGQLEVKNTGSPLAWFGVFADYLEIAADVIPAYLSDPAGAYLSPICPGISRGDYTAAFAKVRDYIRAGDIYQANLTFRADAQYAGNPLALYAAIRPNAAAGYGGVIWTGEQWLLSFSPELFFALKDGRVTTKPMKGTAVRDPDPICDTAIAAALKADPKQRAENLMIVDLLRNDLSRVCDAGTVQVPDLFRIESYPTVHQMTSTVTGALKSGHDAADLIEAIFPCGSITGAPKIRAMQIIEEIEHSQRGVYCGSIGRIDANGDAAFNVAIRTFSLCEDTKRVSMGLGSGVVADSNEAGEWAECLAKGNFARVNNYGFDLIETMRFEPDQGVLRLELHLERMKESARSLGFEFDRHAARNQLHAVTFHLEAASKIRLLLGRTGAIAIEIRSAPVMPAKPWRVTVVPMSVHAADFRLAHKTSDRIFYDEPRVSRIDIDEVLFTDADGYLTEGSITALYIERDAMLLTPKLSRGLLPSILRRELIESGKAIEADLRIEDLSDGFFLGNSLRGLFAARLVV